MVSPRRNNERGRVLGVGAVVIISTGAFILGYTFAVNSILSSPNADATSSSSTAGAFISASSSPPNNNVDTASERAEMMRNINDFQQSFHKTDKTFMHGYHWFYGRHLPTKGKEDLAILEIGSRRGDSALAWKEYFGSNTRIDMITYGGSNDHLKFDNPTVDCKNCGIHTFYCDQSDAEKLEKDVIAARPDGWDIVIDDGSHVPAHNVISFEVLWKNVRPGGIYVVEDIETSYYPKGEVYGYTYEAGILAASPLNALSRFRQYVDVINREYMGPSGHKFSLFDGDDTIMEIGFARNIMFVRKALKGADSDGKSYDYYPKNPWKLPGNNLITNTLEEALENFREQSKLLDKWRKST